MGKQIPTLVEASAAVPVAPKAHSIEVEAAATEWANPVCTFTDYVLGTNSRRCGPTVAAASFSTTNNTKELVSLSKVSKRGRLASTHPPMAPSVFLMELLCQLLKLAASKFLCFIIFTDKLSLNQNQLTHQHTQLAAQILSALGKDVALGSIRQSSGCAADSHLVSIAPHGAQLSYI